MTSKLLKYSTNNPEYGKIDFFYSPDMKEDIQLDREIDLDIASWKTIDLFLTVNPDYKKLIEVYSKKNNLENIAILAAHGTDKKGNWYYFINEETKSMQKWINSIDGKYKVIILHSCNPGSNELYCKKTPIIAPNDVFSNDLLNNSKVQIEITMPDIGILEDHMLKEELRKLQEK